MADRQIDFTPTEGDNTVRPRIRQHTHRLDGQMSLWHSLEVTCKCQSKPKHKVCQLPVSFTHAHTHTHK